MYLYLPQTQLSREIVGCQVIFRSNLLPASFHDRVSGQSCHPTVPTRPYVFGLPDTLNLVYPKVGMPTIGHTQLPVLCESYLLCALLQGSTSYRGPR